MGSRMDVLSTVLKTVKLEGEMFYNAEFSAPWSFRAPPSCLVAPYLPPEPRHVIMCHLLTHGRAYTNVEQARIANGAKSGQLTPRETSQIENREANIDREVRNDRAVNGGKLTLPERAQANHQQHNAVRSGRRIVQNHQIRCTTTMVNPLARISLSWW
jgi:Cupin